MDSVSKNGKKNIEGALYDTKQMQHSRLEQFWKKAI